MNAYRYWRLLCKNVPSSSFVLLAELDLCISGGTDVTGSGTASASSVYSSNPIYAISNAFDNNSNTWWHSYSSPTPHWIQYDFGAGVAYEIVEYRIKGHSMVYMPSTWLLLASDDGQYWTFKDEQNSQVWAEGETKTFAIDTPLVAAEFPSSQEPVIDASHYWIHSTVDRLGVPGRYPVRLYNRASGALLRESKSNATTGGYQFQFLPYLERGYQVIALDDPATRSDPKNAAIADLMTPEAIP